MKATFMYGPGDVRVEEIEKPKIIEPTDAVIKLAATCVCGSDLWPYRGIEDLPAPRQMGHEYVGVVEEVGSKVSHIKVGDFVVGSFCISDNTCDICASGYPSRCTHGGFVGNAQAEYLRVPLADGTLVATPSQPEPDLIPHLSRLLMYLAPAGLPPMKPKLAPGKR